MSESIKSTSGLDNETSGSLGNNQESNSTSGEKDSKAAFEAKLLKEKKNAMLALQQANEKLAKYEAEKAEKEEQELIKQKEFQQVIEGLKVKLTSAERKALELEEEKKTALKHTEVLKELKKLGFIDNDSNREAALKLIESKQITIDPSTSLVLGADDVAKSFMQKYSTLGFFGKQESHSTFNAAKLNFSSNKLDMETIQKMPKAEKLKLMAELAAQGS